MKGEILLQNVFYLFIIAIILEACIMAIFSINIIKEMSDNRALQSIKDIIIILLSFLICWKQTSLQIFHNTGLVLKPDLINIIISGLVLARMTHIVSNFFEKVRNR